ncbi:MAG: hypothetical protein LBO64_02335 [Desulfovibrio sp.]|nr:hypothetical protein [Desulfovibrio sp.]
MNAADKARLFASGVVTKETTHASGVVTQETTHASGVVTQETTHEDSNWLREITSPGTAVAIRTPRGLGNDWREDSNWLREITSPGTAVAIRKPRGLGNVWRDALYGPDQAVDHETRIQAARRVLLSEDGLTLIKTFSPCLRGRVNAENSHALAYAASGVVTQETTHEDSNLLREIASSRTAVAIRKPRGLGNVWRAGRRSVLLDAVAVSGASPLTDSDSNFSASGVVTQETTHEDSNWLREITSPRTAVAIRTPRGLGNDWREDSNWLRKILSARTAVAICTPRRLGYSYRAVAQQRWIRPGRA